MTDPAHGPADVNRRLADCTMAFALLGDLASARREDEAIDRVFGLFTSLCAPRRLAYALVPESGPARLVLPPGGRGGFDVDELVGLRESWTATPSGEGFVLRIADAGGTLGVVAIDAVAVPSRLGDYVNLGLSLASVCALAIRNARTWERLEATIASREAALDEVKALRGLLPICAACKRVRNDAGAWSRIEEYVSSHLDVRFTHGICPACAQRLYGDVM